MKFVIQLLAVCTFSFTFFQPVYTIAQQAIPVHTVANHGIEPDHSKDELAESSLTSSISGEAYGAAKSTATIFQVTLNGPDDPRRFYAAKSFGAARSFRFDRLSPGKYWIQVSSGAGTMIQALPNVKELVVEPGKNYISDVEFRAR